MINIELLETKNDQGTLKEDKDTFNRRVRSDLIKLLETKKNCDYTYLTENSVRIYGPNHEDCIDVKREILKICKNHHTLQRSQHKLPNIRCSKIITIDPPQKSRPAPPELNTGSRKLSTPANSPSHKLLPENLIDTEPPNKIFKTEAPKEKTTTPKSNLNKTSPQKIIILKDEIVKQAGNKQRIIEAIPPIITQTKHQCVENKETVLYISHENSAKITDFLEIFTGAFLGIQEFHLNYISGRDQTHKIIFLDEDVTELFIMQLENFEYGLRTFNFNSFKLLTAPQMILQQIQTNINNTKF